MNPVLCEAAKSFGPYEVLETLGRGATATVYKARHKPTGKYAAIKVGGSFLEWKPGDLERFQREFTVIRQLRHPNIVGALAFGEHDEVPYLVLEFVPGQNLEQRLKEKGALPLDETVAIFLQVASGLRYLHDENILHRDIKPSNIFLGRDNRAKLGDFGLLKMLTDDSRITRTRQGMGTMEYGAPEQFEDAKRVDRRCDLYSLAATLYTALTGKFPFGVGGNLHILQRKLLNQFVPLRLALPSFNPAIDQLVTRSLDPDPRRRPQDCGEFVDVLQSHLDRPVSISASSADISLPKLKPRVGAERRATVRFAADLTTTFVPFHQNMRGRWEAVVLDVSPMGFRMQTPRPVAVDSVLQVTLNKSGNSELALVRWVKPGKGDSQIVGCAFVHPLPTREFEAIYRPRPADGADSSISKKK